MKKIIFLASVISLSSFARADDRDYGNLIPGDHFQINQSRAKLKESADISNFEIKVTPEREEFTYKVNSSKTPRKISGKKASFKLTVEKVGGKVSRITSMDFLNGDTDQKGQLIQSNLIDESGYVKSSTGCFEDYKTGIFDFKSNKTGQRCITVNTNVCLYLENNKVDKELVNEIKSCSDLLSSLSQHQSKLIEMSREEQKADLKAISKLNSRFIPTKFRNYFELESKTLSDVSEITQGYEKAISQCQHLKTNDYLAPPKAIPVDEKNESSSKQ
jgi:hypothetical protein